MERPQVRWETSHQTGEKERASVLTENPGEDQWGQNCEAGNSDSDAQSGYSGLGELSPKPGGEENLSKGGPCHLAKALEMGMSATPEQAAQMDKRPILYSARAAKLDVWYNGSK